MEGLLQGFFWLFFFLFFFKLFPFLFIPVDTWDRIYLIQLQYLAPIDDTQIDALVFNVSTKNNFKKQQTNSNIHQK